MHRDVRVKEQQQQQSEWDGTGWKEEEEMSRSIIHSLVGI